MDLSNKEQNNKAKQDRAFWQPAMVIFSQVTGWIAAPIIIALFLGKYLDQKYNTEPWIFLGLTALSFVVSCVGIVRITLNYTKKVEQELKEKKDFTDGSPMNHGSITDKK